ncbi:hypothetical protein J5U18_03385 [Sphingobacteriaceae bacterium WQ 2009]|uniref:Fimbrillin family protein n=1 Tax=Rhinopithecimicrobium faecis TaxID=2820698 RepID=A0A8T4H753_9SPHI|nr:hypothetical protein [Sphingobacteriaceae bacterium WQ 2009]
MKNLYLKNITKAILLFITVVQLAACSKTTDVTNNEQNGNTVIKIITPTIGESSNPELVASTSKKIGEVQEEIVPLDNGSFVIATLTPQANSSTEIKKLAATVGPGLITTLAKGVKYRLVVYTNDGDYVTQRDYAAGSEANTEVLSLNGGETYNFIVYSVNSSTSLPALLNGDKLATANLDNITEDLMYFKTSFKVQGERENKLSITLNHQFSKISTTVKLTESIDAVGVTVSTLGNVNNVVFSNLSPYGGIKFANNEVTFSPITETQKIIAPFIASTKTNREVKAEEVLLISPNTNSASITIPAITLKDNLNSYTLGDIVLNGIKTVPGHKYNLTLKVFKPCTTLIVPTDGGGTSFTLGSASNTAATRKVFTFPAADFGYTFDISTIDNSFNLEINGTYITNKEINFQISDGNTSNITFADGSAWQVNSIPAIWSIIGTEATPAVRVVIDVKGKISLYGSKITDGPLVPLKLKAGTTFNKVVWNSTSTNTVVASQIAHKTTNMNGFGKGYRIITCP